MKQIDIAELEKLEAEAKLQIESDVGRRFMARTMPVGPQTILALCEEIKSLRECQREALELCEWLRAGYGGMFGTQALSAHEDAVILIEGKTEAFLAKYKERE